MLVIVLSSDEYRTLRNTVPVFNFAHANKSPWLLAFNTLKMFVIKLTNFRRVLYCVKFGTSGDNINYAMFCDVDIACYIDVNILYIVPEGIRTQVIVHVRLVLLVLVTCSKKRKRKAVRFVHRFRMRA